jgi:hypothetical protein
MRRVVFYSWQSDLPNPTNRGFIQKALETAAAAIAGDNTVAIEPVIDRDTEGVPGSPDISATIFAKITAADVVVVDVSIINAGSGGRSTPNPNVLIELGYALNALGHERVILVFNKAYGRIEDLPFDLRTRRVVVYEATPEAEGRSAVRSDLSKKLDAAIRTALQHLPAPTLVSQEIAAVTAIEEQRPNRILLLRRTLGEVLSELDTLKPPRQTDGGTAEDLERAIEQTQVPVARFSKIVEAAAAMNDADAILEAYRWLGSIFERYDLPKDFTGAFHETDFDYFRFLGHELIVTIIAFLLREQRWALVERLFKEPIVVRYMRNRNGPGTVEWNYACRHVAWLGVLNAGRRRVSVHADILHARHTTGGLATVLPVDEFVAADFFLFLKGELSPEQSGPHFSWLPWSVLCLRGTPMFILAAEQKAVAQHLARALGLPSVDVFKSRLTERGAHVSRFFNHVFWDYPIRAEELKKIGTV